MDHAAIGRAMQEEREGKRLRRKQSNRESARRSRLRKQAESESLTTRVEHLTTENARLREANQALQARLDAFQGRRDREHEQARPPLAALCVVACSITHKVHHDAHMLPEVHQHAWKPARASEPESTSRHAQSWQVHCI